VAATDGDNWVWHADADLEDPRGPVDLSGAWHDGVVTLGGRTEAAHGEVMVWQVVARWRASPVAGCEGEEVR
jgi:hypothetical protein